MSYTLELYIYNADRAYLEPINGSSHYDAGCTVDQYLEALPQDERWSATLYWGSEVLVKYESNAERNANFAEHICIHALDPTAAELASIPF